jgi:putative MATE family efflux protein
MSDDLSKQRGDYTQGSIISSILKMGLPSMFGFISQNIYALADTYWVSRLPAAESAVAAVTFFHSIMWVYMSFNILVGAGSVPVISQRYGEKKFDETEKAIKETLSLKLAIGVVFGALGFIFVEDMLYLVGARGEALELGVVYGRIMFIGTPFFQATYSIYTAMRGVANPKMAMILMIASNILNIVLDPILMFGYLGFPALGIKGAAIASVFSFTLTLAVGLLLFYFDFTNIALHIKGKLPMALHSSAKLLKIGFPAWVGEISFSAARLLVVPMIATFGTNVVAAYGVGSQITSLGIMILVGMGLGLSSLIGHNVGGGKIERAKKTGDQAVILGVVIMTIYGLITFFFAEPIIRAFFDNADTVTTGASMLRIFALGFPFFGAFFMVQEIHVGVGLNSPAMVMTLVHSWALEVVPIYFFTQYLGYDADAIWWTITVSGVIISVAFYLYYLRGRWLTVKL